MAGQITKNSGTPATLDDVARMYQKKLSSASAENAKSLYIMRKMGDLPAVYSADMPATADQEALAAAEYVIREQYRADMKIHAPKFVQPATPQAEAAAEAAANTERPVDISKLTGYEKIQLGLQRQNAGK